MCCVLNAAVVSSLRQEVLPKETIYGYKKCKCRIT